MLYIGQTQRDKRWNTKGRTGIMKTQRQHRENQNAMTDNKLKQCMKGESIIKTKNTLSAVVIVIAMLLSTSFASTELHAYTYTLENKTPYAFSGILKQWWWFYFYQEILINIPGYKKSSFSEWNLNCMMSIEGYIQVRENEKIEIKSKYYPVGFCADHSYVLKQTEYNDPRVGKGVIFSLCETDRSNCRQAIWRQDKP